MENNILHGTNSSNLRIEFEHISVFADLGLILYVLKYSKPGSAPVYKPFIVEVNYNCNILDDGEFYPYAHIARNEAVQYINQRNSNGSR